MIWVERCFTVQITPICEVLKLWVPFNNSPSLRRWTNNRLKIPVVWYSLLNGLFVRYHSVAVDISLPISSVGFLYFSIAFCSPVVCENPKDKTNICLNTYKSLIWIVRKPNMYLNAMTNAFYEIDKWYGCIWSISVHIFFVSLHLFLGRCEIVSIL